MNDIEGLGDQVLELRDEVARLRAVIAEAVADAVESEKAANEGEDEHGNGMAYQATGTLRILAKATQTDEREAGK